MSINKLNRLTELDIEINGILDLAKSEHRDITAAEVERLDGLRTEILAIDISLDVEKYSDPGRSSGRKTAPNAASLSASRVSYGSAARAGKVQGGSGIGALAIAAFQHAKVARQGGHLDPLSQEVLNGPTTVSTEGTGADGGFAVPPGFQTEIMEKVMSEESLLGRANVVETAGNSFSFPKDETTPWQSSGGLRAYWESEGHQLTQSKVALEVEDLRLNKLTALIPVTSELMEDAQPWTLFYGSASLKYSTGRFRVPWSPAPAPERRRVS